MSEITAEELVKQFDLLRDSIDSKKYEKALKKFVKSHWTMGIASTVEQAKTAILADKLLATIFIKDYVCNS